ncbi:MAG: hypothetical protein MJZ17_11310 [Bacteroidales bacterium]|nr:hypothetical protein [Bacteroidales bacterium]
MKKLQFDNGIRELCINDNPNAVIRICTNDFSLPTRFQAMYDNVAKLLAELEPSPEAFAKADKEIRAQVDTLLGSPVSDTVFGSVNCLTNAGGQPIVINFLEAVLPFIEESVKSENEAAKQRVSKYTEQLADIPQE